MFKILFGKKLEEFDKTIQRQQELEIEIQKLKQQLDDTCEAINVQSETYNKKLEETVEKQSKKNEGLNNQIQAANGWIKDTREKMWYMSSDIAELKKEQIHLKNELEKYSLKKSENTGWTYYYNLGDNYFKLEYRQNINKTLIESL